MPIRAVVIGCSTGGLTALRTVLAPLPADFPAAVVIVSHTPASGDGRMLAFVLQSSCRLMIEEAEPMAPLCPGQVYIAPAGYHLLVERDRSFALSVDARVCNVRPAVDVLFESAAEAFGEEIIGIILTGANQDGSRGLKAIKEAGGGGIVQDPDTAEAREMPEAAIAIGAADWIVPLEQIGAFLVTLVMPAETKTNQGTNRTAPGPDTVEGRPDDDR